MRHRRLDGLARSVGEGCALRGESREHAVLQHHHVARGVHDRDGVRCHVAALLAVTDHNGRVLARHGDHARLVLAHSRHAIGAHQALARLAQRGNQIMRARLAVTTVVCLLKQVGQKPVVSVCL